MKISEDIKSISYVKSHTNQVLEQIRKTGRPIIITQNGEPAAVLQDVESYEQFQETQAVAQIIITGNKEMQLNQVHDHKEVISAARKQIKNKR